MKQSSQNTWYKSYGNGLFLKDYELFLWEYLSFLDGKIVSLCSCQGLPAAPNLWRKEKQPLASPQHGTRLHACNAGA